MEKRVTQYSIILVGDSGVGKTNFAEVFVKGRGAFSTIYITTAGAERYKKTVTVNKEKISLNIWDLSGANEFRTRITYNFNGADGIMLCYSVASEESWNNIDNWITTIQWQIGKNEFDKAEKLIVGLKCDQCTRAVPDTDVALKSTSLSNSDVLLASSRTFNNVQEAFYSLVERIHSKRNPPQTEAQQETKRSSRCSLL